MNLKETLIKEGIVKIKKEGEELFTLKSGKKSRLFIDIKEASLNPRILDTITYYIHEIVHRHTSNMLIDYLSGDNDLSGDDDLSDMDIFEFDTIGSVAFGGVLIATAFSIESKIRQIIVRSEKHDRGTETKIIGNCKSRKVLLIEDVATTGNSIINAVRYIREVGGICSTCIVIIDREEGAKEWCDINDIKLYSLLKKSDFGITEE